MADNEDRRLHEVPRDVRKSAREMLLRAWERFADNMDDNIHDGADTPEDAWEMFGAFVEDCHECWPNVCEAEREEMESK